MPVDAISGSVPGRIKVVYPGAASVHPEFNFDQTFARTHRFEPEAGEKPDYSAPVGKSRDGPSSPDSDQPTDAAHDSSSKSAKVEADANEDSQTDPNVDDDNRDILVDDAANPEVAPPLQAQVLTATIGVVRPVVRTGSSPSSQATIVNSSPSNTGSPMDEGQVAPTTVGAIPSDFAHENNTDANAEGYLHQHADPDTGRYAPSAALVVSIEVGGSKLEATSTLPPTGLAQPPPVGAEEQANVVRVVRGINSVVQQNGGTVTLRLQPSGLGFVRIELRILDGMVQASFQTEHESVRILLNHQMSQLRLALESHGLSVDRLNVQTMQPEDSTTDTNHQEEAPNDGRSRGTFDSGSDEDPSESDRRSDDDREENFESTLNAVV